MTICALRFPCALHSKTKNHLLINSRFLIPSPNRTLASFSFHPQIKLSASPNPSPVPRIMSSAISGSNENTSIVMPGDITTLLERVEVLDLTGKAIPITDLWKDRKAVVAFARHFGCPLCRKRAEFLAAKKERMDAAGVALVLIGPGNVDQAKEFSEKTKFQGGFFLNPRFQYQEDFVYSDSIRSGVTKVIERLARDVTFAIEATREVAQFRGKIGRFRDLTTQTVIGIMNPEIYADANHSSYDALGFVSGISTIFTPSAGLKMIQSYREGYRTEWGLSLQGHTMAKGAWQQGGIIVAGPGKGNFTYIHKDKEAGDDPAIEDIMKACCP